MNQYTNELTPELTAFLKNPYPPEQRESASDDQRQVFQSHVEGLKERSLLAIWRYATKGALTRDGGRIEHATSEMCIACEDGTHLNKAVIGDYVIYPDGSRAQIISGTTGVTEEYGKAYAIVGSKLDNGDEIVSTPQDAVLLAKWDNSTYPADFLIPMAL